MRVSTAQLYSQGVSAIQNQQAKMSKTQLQMATGRRLLTPADDPAAAAAALELTQAKTLTAQYQQNADAANARLSLEESVLSGVVDVLQRVRELAVRANNDSLDAVDRIAVAEEVQQRLDELLQLANARDANGEYMFSGFQSLTTTFVQPAPGVFVYQGDQGQRHLQISATRQIPIGDTGFDVFMNVPGVGGPTDTFSIVFDFITDLNADNPSPDTITDLDAAMDQILATRSDIGARLNAVETQQDINDAFILNMETTLSDIQDLDYDEAVTRFNLEQAGLEAAQQSFLRIQGLSLFDYL